MADQLILKNKILAARRLRFGFSEIHHQKRSFGYKILKFNYNLGMLVFVFNSVHQKLKRYVVFCGKAGLRSEEAD